VVNEEFVAVFSGDEPTSLLIAEPLQDAVLAIIIVVPIAIGSRFLRVR